MAHYCDVLPCYYIYNQSGYLNSLLFSCYAMLFLGINTSHCHLVAEKSTFELLLGNNNKLILYCLTSVQKYNLFSSTTRWQSNWEYGSAYQKHDIHMKNKRLSRYIDCYTTKRGNLNVITSIYLNVMLHV